MHLLKNQIAFFALELPTSYLSMIENPGPHDRVHAVNFPGAVAMPSPSSLASVDAKHVAHFQHVNAKIGESFYDLYSRLHTAHGKNPWIDPDA